MNAFTHHFLFEFKTGLRSASSMLMNYLFPLGFYIMVGLIMTQINPGFKETIIPGVILVSLMAATLLGFPGPLVEAREAGIYRSYKINAVPAAAILLIPMLTTVFHSLIVSGLISLSANPFFDGVKPENWLWFGLITIIAALSLGCVGALIGVISSGSRSVVLWSQLIFLPAMLLGGLMMPLNLLPESVLNFSFLLPTTYAMQAYSGLAYNQATIINPWLALIVLISAGVFSLILALFLFRWDNQNSQGVKQNALALLAWLPFIVGMILR